MLIRAFVIWLALLAAAIVNGAAREGLLIPRTGEAVGHALSSITLSAAILLLAWLSIGWIRPYSTSDAWRVGFAWVSLTLAFEFLAGHYLFGNSWERLLADYNVLAGRIWILVLIITLSAPAIAAAARGLGAGASR